MRAANEAWHVLRDPTRRLAHDRELGIDHGPRYATDLPSESADVPVTEQVEDRSPQPTRPGDLVVLVPPALLAAAVVCFAVGTLMLNATLFAVAAAALLLSGIAFVLTPFVALARDRRRARARR